MDTLREIFSPDFLLRNSFYTSLLVGAVCPLVGLWLILRRLVFLGVALPQVSSCGVAFAFALPGWGLMHHAHDSAEERILALAGSAVFTLAAILALAFLERRGRSPAEGRIGAVYVLAGAWSILLLVKNPFGEHGILDLLKGEIIAISDLDLAVSAVTAALVAATLLIFHKEFLLVSFDRDMAVSLKKNVVLWDVLLYAVIGLTIAETVLSVGPMVTFGFLLLPPLIARQFAANMLRFALLAPAFGIAGAFAGFCIAYKWDLPVGPTDVALLGVCYAAASLIRRK
jgi:ABC-type Mn2+/Zn2+ transport system permease subunit